MENYDYMESRDPWRYEISRIKPIELKFKLSLGVNFMNFTFQTWMAAMKYAFEYWQVAIALNDMKF